MEPNIAYPLLPTLYVGDLHKNVTENMLFNKFSQAGQVISIRVCRDLNTRISLGYAYVNFVNYADAQRAMDMMNYDVLYGHPIRIMWCERDPSRRRFPIGNLFLKNLHSSINSRALYDMCQEYGNITSCKVALDKKLRSRCFGFVQYATEEAANRAIKHLNGKMLYGKSLLVTHFITRNERERLNEESARRSTNVYVKNLPKDITEDELRFLFLIYGNITSCKIMTKPDGTSKGFGFVAFENPSSAAAAVEGWNGRELGEGMKLYVGHAQKRAEREEQLRQYFGMRYSWLGLELHNLHVKNLDDSIDDERLRLEFGRFGTVMSAKVMMENNNNQGFGFVCFANAEEAARARAEMNGRFLESRPLYVSFARQKENRRARRNGFMQ